MYSNARTRFLSFGKRFASGAGHKSRSQQVEQKRKQTLLIYSRTHIHTRPPPVHHRGTHPTAGWRFFIMIIFFYYNIVVIFSDAVYGLRFIGGLTTCTDVSLFTPLVVVGLLVGAFVFAFTSAPAEVFTRYTQTSVAEQQVLIRSTASRIPVTHRWRIVCVCTARVIYYVGSRLRSKGV